ncbi:22631_t:CDS:2 [Dentiscutata erythropus]|uniref:22631_t:CDS:1 n=1 Tax=Dentiscutata erythropus TaxID=1348616 RepID=A0A9N8ZU16_9GLOM|nr:22631_t:CDS:2 [Dentiscutata erythropus]
MSISTIGAAAQNLEEEGVLGAKDLVGIKGFENLVGVGGLGSLVGVGLVGVGLGSLVGVKNLGSLVGGFVEMKGLVVIRDLIKIKYFKIRSFVKLKL